METPVPSSAPDVVDLSDAAPEDTAVLHLTRPGATDEERIPLNWSVTFAGPGHPQTVAWNDEQGRRGLRKSQALEAQVRNGRKVKADDTSLEETRQENARWILARVVHWPPMRAPWVRDEPILHTDPAALTFLLHPKSTFIYVQMVDFLVAEKSFTKRSVTT